MICVLATVCWLNNVLFVVNGMVLKLRNTR
jgi:hypothetical protein